MQSTKIPILSPGFGEAFHLFEFINDLYIGIIAAAGDCALSDGGLYRAAGLGAVRAVAETATVKIGGEFGEEEAEFEGRNAPDSEDLYAGGIGHIAEFCPHKLDAGRGVLAHARSFGYGCCCGFETRDKHAQKR